MRETVSINGLTLCHKNSDGFVRSTLPDVCKSPSAPVPYTNVAFAKTLADGTVTVRSNGGAMNGVLGSRFATSIGDEPGVGGGVVSGVNMSEATFISFSPNVFMEGRAVTRLTDKMLLNKGNTVSVGGYYTGPLPATPLLEEICIIACACAAAGNANQACVDGGLTLAHGATNTKTDGVFPEARYTMVDGDYKLATDPSSGMPLTRGPYPHPDVTRLSGGSVAEMVEVKFLNNRDRYRKDQRQVYDDIAKDNGVAHKTLNFPDDCDCEQKPKPVPVPAPAPQEEEESNMSKVRAWAAAHPGEAIGIGVVAAVGVGALIFFSGGAAAPALAAAL
jgi:hypothetical protein